MLRPHRGTILLPGCSFHGVHCLNNLPTVAIRRSGLRIDSSGGVIGAGCLVRTSRRGGIFLLLWHRLGLNNPLGSFAPEAEELLLVPRFGEMFLKSLGNFFFSVFIPFCLPLSQGGPSSWSFGVTLVRIGLAGPGIGTTKLSKLGYYRNLFNLFCHILHIFGTCPGETILFISFLFSQ